MISRRLFTLALGLSVFSLWGCSQGLDFLSRSFIPVTQTRSEAISSTLTQVIPAGFQAFEQEALSLQSAVQTLLAAPSEANLEQARQSWRATAKNWVSTEAYQFGPVNDDRVRQQIDFWPRRLDHMQAVLADSEPLTIDKLGASRRGLPVLEWLLFGSPASELLASGEQRAKSYLGLLADDLVLQAQRVSADWRDQDASYLRQLQGQDNTSNLLLNQWVLLLEDTKNKRIGIPAGLMGAVPAPEQREAPESNSSQLLLIAALDGFEQAYTANSAEGVSKYLVSLGHRQLDQQLRAHLAKLRQDIKALPEPLDTILKDSPQSLAPVYEDLKTLLRYVKVDLASALNETVNFTDNDGD